MGIDRRSLSKINRKLATGLDTDEKWRMVRVPASEDVWLAWKLYCEKANVSMGRALSALIENELRSLIGGDIEGPVRVIDVERALRDREAELVARERRVRALERNIRGRERRLAAGNRGSGPGRPVLPDVGRNELCPCGSGLKYKRCHGMPT